MSGAPVGDRQVARYEFRMQRLFVEDGLSAGAVLPLGRDQSHYLAHVLRLPPGASLLLFNGRDGEWRGTLAQVTKKGVTVRAENQTRPQEPAAPLTYAFAPLKQARLDYMIQKAVEMGAGILQPVLTQHTQNARITVERMQANAIEAAEQCGILAVPDVRPEMKLAQFLAQRDSGDPLIFADEDAPLHGGMDALGALYGKRMTLLIGPEGGFSNDERALLLKQTNIIRLSLGPRILRADTAAVAGLALLQSIAGDWR